MDWALYLHQLQKFIGFRFSSPPYVLLLAGLFIGLTSGAAFAAVLRQRVKEWSRDFSPRIFNQWGKLQLLIPFVGTCIGLCLFAASGLEMLRFSTVVSYTLALPLTILICWLIWSRIGSNLGKQVMRSYWRNHSKSPGKGETA